MENQERELALKMCDLLRGMAELQIETHRSLRALAHALNAQLPNLEAEYRKAQADALFATQVSSKANRMILEIDDIAARLKATSI